MAQTHSFLPLFAGWPHADTPPCRHPHEAGLCREYGCSPTSGAMARPCSSSWHCPDPDLGVTSLLAWLWDSGTHGEVATTPNPRPGCVQVCLQAPCATASPKLPLLCPPLPLLHGVWMLGLTPVSPALWSPWQTFPFFGVVPAILNESGEELEGEAEGYLVRQG